MSTARGQPAASRSSPHTSSANMSGEASRCEAAGLRRSLRWGGAGPPLTPAARLRWRLRGGGWARRAGARAPLASAASGAGRGADLLGLRRRPAATSALPRRRAATGWHCGLRLAGIAPLPLALLLVRLVLFGFLINFICSPWPLPSSSPSFPCGSRPRPRLARRLTAEGETGTGCRGQCPRGATAAPDAAAPVGTPRSDAAARPAGAAAAAGVASAAAARASAATAAWPAGP
eukprot:3377361-Alexandrium_andersonii.AAC.1